MSVSIDVRIDMHFTSNLVDQAMYILYVLSLWIMPESFGYMIGRVLIRDGGRFVHLFMIIFVSLRRLVKAA